MVFVRRLLLALLLTSAVIPSCLAFSTYPALSIRKIFRDSSRSNIKAISGSDATDGGFGITKYITTTYEANLAADQGQKRQRKFRKNAADAKKDKAYRFTYDTNELVIGDRSNSATTAIILIMPIGVGIGKWYYNRLLASLQEQYGDIEHRLVFLAPDLLGSATASGPVNIHGEAVRKIPLLNITDWTDQVTHLMADYEAKSKTEGHTIGSWSVVANGGCAPIALKVAATSSQNIAPFKAAITNVIISSPPRLPFFLNSTPNPTKVRKSYRTLSGITGKLFWWYSLRKGGRFIQKFSERNLVGDAANLGEEWTPNCLEAARLHGGKSRYSTFAFLAGTLQDGCLDSLNALKGSNVTIDFIRGDDKRRNRAKSWFWTQKKKGGGSDSRSKGDIDEENNSISTEAEEETIQQYVSNNGNRGNELFVGGRISLAWEDSNGYAKRLMEILCK